MTPRKLPGRAAARALATLLAVGASLPLPLALGLAGGCAAPAARPAGERFTCPMHPGYLSDHPGDCPICGMRLVPAAAEDHAAEDQHPAPAGASPPAAGEPALAPLRIDEEGRRRMGLRTVAVRRQALAPAIRTVGRVAVDERRVVRVQPRFEGFVERLDADFTGKRVAPGETLCTVYSPELLATQQELLLALRSRGALEGAGLPDAAEAARARLRLLGVGPAAIAEVERTGRPLAAVPVAAPRGGYITVKNVVAGARLPIDQPAFEIADYSRVWVLADIYEQELPRVRVGQPATITLPYWPGLELHGRASYIYPTVDDKTRTARVRIEVPNPDGALKADMFADVILEAVAAPVLVVPDDAVLDSGARRLVFVDRDDGVLEPRAVTLGPRAAGLVEVRAGLREGERVATGASFLLDAESRLRSALGAALATPPAAPDPRDPTRPATPPGVRP